MNKKFSKLLLTSASAVALLAAYPSVAQNANEALGLDVQSITAEAATTAGNAFVKRVMDLPNVSELAGLSSAEIKQHADTMKSVRRAYTRLSAADKDAKVETWEGYLYHKERAIGNVFVEIVKALPTIADMESYDSADFAAVQDAARRARTQYNDLSKVAKENDLVKTWLVYLDQKEQPLGITFVDLVGSIPNVPTIETLSEKGLEAARETVVAAKASYNLLSDAAKGDRLVKQWVVYLDAKEAAIEAATPVEKELSVESVSAINAEEILVTFSKDVSATAADKANYEISKNGTKVAGSSAIQDIKVSGNTALIRLVANEQAVEGDKYVVQTNDAITTKAGEALSRYASPEYTYKNGAAPSLQNIELDAAADTLTLSFDRPVASDTTLVKVDGIDIVNKNLTAVDATKAGNYKYTIALSGSVTANQLKSFKAEGSHEVVIFDVKDTATTNAVNNSVVSGAYTVTKDTAAPTVVVVKALSSNKFFIETNRAVDLTNATLKVEKGNHEFVKGNNIALDTSVQFEAVGTHEGKPGIFVVITEDSVAGDENPLYKGTESSANLKVTLENYKANDLVGAKYVGNVTLRKDATKPKVKTTSLNTAGKKLNVTFEDTIAAAPAAADVIVRDKDGVRLPTANVALSNDVMEIEISSVTDDKAPYTVEFTAGKFQYKGEKTSVAGYVVNSLKNDKITATVRSSETGFKYKAFSDLPGGAEVSMNNNVIKVDYKTEMSDSARQAANYMLDGKALPAGSTVDFVGNKEVVEIRLPEGSIKTSTGYKLTVSTDITTKAGEHIVKDLQSKGAYEEVVQLVDNTKPELKSAVYVVASNDATATSVIKVTFNEDLASSLNTTDAAKNLKIVINGSEQTGFTVADAVQGDDELEITLGTPVAISQAATISIVADNAGDVHIKDLAIPANDAKVGSVIIANSKELDLNAALDLQVVNTAKANLTIAGNLDNVIADLTLPTLQDGATVSWVSDTPGTVSPDGTVVRPTAPAGDATVKLTATITKGAATDSKTFTVTVKAE